MDGRGKRDENNFGVNNSGDPFRNANHRSTTINHQLFEGRNPFGIGEKGGKYNNEDPFCTVNEQLNNSRKTENVLNDDVDPYMAQTVFLNDDMGTQNMKLNVGVGMKFDTLAECEMFYNTHAKLSGFSMRRSIQRRNCAGTVNLRWWMCSKQGERAVKKFKHIDPIREQRPLTRAGCMARMKVKLDTKSNKYVVTEFNDEHNHPLVKLDKTHLLRSHRSVGKADQSLIIAMRSAGMKTIQIMDYLVKVSGGHQYVGFTAKDLYNYINGIRCEVMKVGDAQSAIAYLYAKIDTDPMFFCRYNAYSNN